MNALTQSNDTSHKTMADKYYSRDKKEENID